MMNWKFVRLPDGNLMITFNEYEDRHKIADTVEHEINSSISFVGRMKDRTKYLEQWLSKNNIHESEVHHGVYLACLNELQMIEELFDECGIDKY